MRAPDAELIDSEGVTPSLVDALEDETEIQAEPLPLDRIVPWWRVWAVAVLAAMPAICAPRRRGVRPGVADRIVPGLAEQPAVHDALGRAGDSRSSRARACRSSWSSTGRSPRDVVLYTRPAGQTDAALAGDRADDRPTRPGLEARGEAGEGRGPADYRVVAGPASSPTYRIGVRYPLALKSFDVELKPPAYTGIKPSTVKGGDLRVIEGPRRRSGSRSTRRRPRRPWS